MSADIQIDRDDLPYRCPECVSEDVIFSDARSDLLCGNCGEEFDREEAVVILGELESARSGEEGERTYTVALLYTADSARMSSRSRPATPGTRTAWRSPRWSSPTMRSTTTAMQRKAPMAGSWSPPSRATAPRPSTRRSSHEPRGPIRARHRRSARLSDRRGRKPAAGPYESRNRWLPATSRHPVRVLVDDQGQRPRRDSCSNATQFGTGVPSSKVFQASGSPTISGSVSSTTIRAFGTCGSGSASTSRCSC